MWMRPPWPAARGSATISSPRSSVKTSGSCKTSAGHLRELDVGAMPSVLLLGYVPASLSPAPARRYARRSS